ncbi:MAG: hypothetical protein ACLUOI_01555 [Eisenbergiella sp.]
MRFVAATTESQAPQETVSKVEETGTAAAETVDISAQGITRRR